ncbi:replication factor A 1, rfa1 [Peziza echinospora]|nr:replication factor A 1, rfa1 [Peziza echinospora]
MDPTSAISIGSLRNVFSGQPGQVLPPIIVQCLQTKNLTPTPQAQERYRVVFSDTEHFVQCMLATQLNYFVKNGELERGAIVRLKSYQANQVNQRRVLIVIDLEVLKEYGLHEKIGTPDSLEKMLVAAGEAPSAPVPTSVSAAAPPAASTANSFYGRPSAPQPVQRYSEPKQNSSYSAQSKSGPHISPIEAISPYQNKWTIKARVTNKSPIKTWKNPRTEGKLFTVTFIDDTGEIRATGFKEQCDSFYDLLQENQVYYISKCRVVMAKKQFSNVNNDYELTFEKDTEIEKCEDASDVPQVRFNFTLLGDLERVGKDTLVDVIGVVKSVGEVSETTSKTTQKSYQKREIELVDTTDYMVRLTVWGAIAQNFEVQPESVVAFKGVKVSDFGGISLSMLMSSSMTIDPDIDEAHKLKGWFIAQDRSKTFSSHQALAGMRSAGGHKDVYKTLGQLVDDKVGEGDEPEYYTTKATIVYIKQENACYAACSSENCNKKVVQVDEGRWTCAKCDKTFPRPQYRYIITISVNDAYNQAWFSCFDDVGRLIMGMSADELETLRGADGMDPDKKDEAAYSEAFSEANGKTYIFRCRAKTDTYNDTSRVRHQVLSASEPNYVAECAKLIETIKLYGQD